MGLDPVTALSLGAGILQFVEFATKLLSVGREIRNTAAGATLEHNELEAITRSLIWLSNKLTKTENDSGQQRNLSDSEQNIMDMISKCQGVGSELIRALENLKLQGRRTKFSSIIQALKTIWSKEKIDNLRLRLEQCRNGVHTALLVSLTAKIDHITPMVLTSLQSGTATDQIRMDTLKAVQDCALSLTEPDGSAAQRQLESEARAILARNMSRLTQQERNEFFRSQILEHLRFDDQEDRESRIQKAHTETFRWIWHDPENNDEILWSNFVTWMKEDSDNLYWITGKPGSGKSILMKYIVHDPRCEKLLRQWAGHQPLVVTKFYFWNSGSQDQMSQEGLLRSILYDALQQMPTLFPRIFRQRWYRCQLFGSDLRHWSPTELYEAFVGLAKCATNFKLCLFVDGLDEFDDDPEILVKLFREALSYPNVKACLSSRPWPVFEEAFRHKPSLRLEDITYPDILAFVTSHFEHNSGFTALKKLEPEFSSTLIENIAQKSCGVFLWVTLVVKSLLNGLSNRDRISDLQRRLDELPGDLELFYQKLFASLETFYLERSSQVFQLLDASQGNLTAIGLFFADEEDSRIIPMALDYPVVALTEQEKQDRYQLVKSRLASYCKGFLEIPDFEYQDLSDSPAPLHETTEESPDSPTPPHQTTEESSNSSTPPHQTTEESSDSPNPRPIIQDQLYEGVSLHLTNGAFHNVIGYPCEITARSFRRFVGRLSPISIQPRRTLRSPPGPPAPPNQTVESPPALPVPPPDQTVRNLSDPPTPPHLRKVAYLHRTVRDFLKSPSIERTIAERAGTYNCSIPLLCSTILMIKTWDPDIAHLSQLADLGKCAMKYAAMAARSSVLEHKLLDEIDRSMEAHNKTSPGWYPLVWLQSACTDSDLTDSPKTFLELASMYELHDYLSSKILQGLPVFSDQNTTPLLYRIVSQYNQYPSFQDPELSNSLLAAPNLKLVEHLLQAGSNPNDVVGDYTVWETILQECIKVSNHRHQLGAKDVESQITPILHSWAHAVEVAIKYGADPRMNRNSQQANCVREAFNQLLPDQAAHLEKLILQMSRRRSKLREFIIPTSRGLNTYIDTTPMPELNRKQRAVMENLGWPISRPAMQRDNETPKRCRPYRTKIENDHSVL